MNEWNKQRAQSNSRVARLSLSKTKPVLSLKSRLIINLDADTFSMFASLFLAGLRGTRTFV